MEQRRAHAVALLLGASLLVGCATFTPQGTVRDPWMPVNRPVHTFNDKADQWVLGPVARGWKKITPSFVRTGIANAFYNLRFPVRLVSSIGQGDAHKVASETARFMSNTIFGLGGLLDFASFVGMEKYDEDMGQMMGKWGVGGGPFVMLPLLGPSNPRDALGLAMETAMNPLFWLGVGLYVTPVRIVNDRARNDDEIETARESALDFYVFVRDAYVRNRDARIRDADPDEAEQGDDDTYDDLYDFEEDEE